MIGTQVRNIIAQALVCLLIAFNVYPTVQNIAVQVLGNGDMIRICTLNGIQTIPASPSDDQEQSQSGHCFFCHTQQMAAITPTNAAFLGPKTAYSERLKLQEYQRLYYKTALKKPHPRGPPIFFST